MQWLCFCLSLRTKSKPTTEGCKCVCNCECSYEGNIHPTGSASISICEKKVGSGFKLQ